MEENKTESTPDQNGLFNYPNKLPADLTVKDLTYLQKRVEKDMPTDNPKSKKVKTAIKVFLRKSDEEHVDNIIFVALFFIIMHSLFAAFSMKGLTLNSLAWPFGFSVSALLLCVIFYEHRAATISVLNNKYSNSITSILKRNLTPFLAVVPLIYFLWPFYAHHGKEAAHGIHIAFALLITLTAYAIKMKAKFMTKKILEKFKIEN
ncbi:hypothetical protein GR140_18965 [Pseudomonas putida]|uniref:hypothetical protein n=1 Tax=Pseudomonas putida TaxID=303 RepID=UPI001BB06A89|nr:hypothetical protein [Pseudomonas putida]QUG90747.1 hypothetical protein GR140_18965 [Pseudomonas putida]